MSIKKLLIGAATGAMILAFALPVGAATTTIYNALPDPLPPNAPSQPFQAQQTSEFGDYIHLGGTARNLATITVGMSTWAVYSDYSTDSRYSENTTNWTHPITINVYSNSLSSNGVPNTLLATKTQDITIPWRPAGDQTCPDTGYGAGFAWKAGDGKCYNGFAFNAVFDLSSLNVTLPNDVIIGVVYNTQSYGPSPIGSNGPYNSLNVLVPPNQTVSVGTDDNNQNVFWNTATAAWYSDGGVAGVGIFRQDTNWLIDGATYGTVAFKVDANVLDTEAPSVPTNLHWVNRSSETVACGSTITDLVAGAVKAVWDPSTDNIGVDHYEYVSFNPLNGWPWPSADSGYVVTNPEYGDTNYTPSVGEYGFMVRAVDAAGNKSAWTDLSKTITDSCKITFSNPPVLLSPSNKDECKKDGWKLFNNPVFKNQGDCVSYVQSKSEVNKLK